MPCVDVAQIVASQSFLSQTASIATTAIFTPPAAGMFRISFYLEGDFGAGGSVSLKIFWTDSLGAMSVTVCSTQAPGGPYALSSNPVSVIHSAASAAISISTTVSVPVTSYSVYVVVEQLS